MSGYCQGRPSSWESLGKQNQALVISQRNKADIAEFPPGQVLQGQDNTSQTLHHLSAQEVGLGTLQGVTGSHEPLFIPNLLSLNPIFIQLGAVAVSLAEVDLSLPGLSSPQRILLDPSLISSLII